MSALGLFLPVMGIALFLALWRIGDRLSANDRARARFVVAMAPGPGEIMRTVLVSDKPLSHEAHARIEQQMAWMAEHPERPMLLEGGLRLERWPMPASGPLEVRAPIDPFEQAAIALRGRRWNTRDADALAELVEIGRELP